MIYECKNCGGNIIFSPKDKGCLCVRCGSVFPIEYEIDNQKNDFSKAQQLNTTENSSVKGYRCESCGAHIVVEKNEIKSKCIYCGSSSIAKVGEDKLSNIDSVIPFAFDKKEALAKFNSKLNKKFYANKKVFKGLKADNFNGVYVNAFVFDLDIDVTYSGVFSYTQTYTDSKGRSQTRTKYRHVNGMFNKKIKDLTIESSSYLTQSELTQILPFDYSQAVKFKTEFTHGYAFEYHDELFKNCFEDAERIVKSKIQSELLSKYDCDRVESLDLIMNYQDKKYNYCLLPVYFVSKEYKNKTHKVLMNGQSGALSRLPKNVGKVLLTIFLILGIVAGIVALAMFMT